VAKKNFKKAVLSKSFMQLGLKFPSIIDEVLERVGA
jgi:speckle-type POZ protein